MVILVSWVTQPLIKFIGFKNVSLDAPDILHAGRTPVSCAFPTVSTGPSCVWLTCMCVCVCVHVQVHTISMCQEESTAGVTLFPGVISSSSPQGRIAECECLAQTQQVRCSHVKARAYRHRETETVFRREQTHLIFSPCTSYLTPFIPPLPALQDHISSNRCLSIYLSTFSPTVRGNRRRRCERHRPLSPCPCWLPLPPSPRLLLQHPLW